MTLLKTGRWSFRVCKRTYFDPMLIEQLSIQNLSSHAVFNYSPKNYILFTHTVSGKERVSITRKLIRYS